MTMAEEEP